MKRLLLTLVVMILALQSPAQEVTPRPARPPVKAYTIPGRAQSTPRASAPALAVPPGGPSLAFTENQDDPAYQSYKEAYNLILDERWENARKTFADLIAKYPQSDYQDDARYWSAYALMHIDRKRSIAAYKEFMKKYPESRYLDDALADLGTLESNVHQTTPLPGATAVDVGGPGNSYSYGIAYAPSMRKVERELLRLQRRNMRVRTTAGTIGIAPFPPGNEKLDPELRLKMDALYAIGETKQDEKAFVALKEVAVDSKQPRQLREAALDALTNFEKFDMTPVLVEIAKNDTSEELQAYAVDYIGEHSKDKDKSVALLVDLFNSVPKHRTAQLETIFYSIAEVGNDKAVDFLSRVALKHDNYELRSDAVYLLGNIGGERARSALYEILKTKTK